ncbi:MAG TPA: mannose-1-phosphate guanylyltransferase [Bacillota bacterium]|nr:mannose-1-phosphate guanylyltransferase [Bacillota bacterium]
MIFPVIMAGGTGTRFWPKSRSRFPKQFLELSNDESLLQATFRRLSGLAPFKELYVVTNRRYASLVSNQLPQLPTNNLIIEPMRRDTASCIGLAALFLSKINPEGVMVIVPSDHQIGNEEVFMASLRQAARVAAENDCIITLGISPDEPKTGYGYIRMGEMWDGIGSEGEVYYCDGFTEKPDVETAMQYLRKGNYLWNSGIFVCRAKVMLEAISMYMPRLFRCLERIGSHFGTPVQDEEIRRAYRDMEKVSIDFGIMEKAKNILVIPCNCDWDDMGSWTIVGKMLAKDANNNSVLGAHVGMDTHNCVLVGCEHKLIATLGVENLIIVLTKDVVMVCGRDRDQEVKELVKMVKTPDLRKFW